MGYKGTSCDEILKNSLANEKYMHAETPRLHFQTLFQHEVFRIILTLNAGSHCLRHRNHGNTINVFYFLDKKA